MEQGPNTATGLIKILPSTNSEISRFAAQVVQSVQAGETDAIEMLVMLRAFAKASELIIDCIKSNIDTAADKYSEKQFEVFGARVEKSETGVKYAYEKTGDSVWEMLKVNADKASEELKARETFLKAVKDPITTLDELTGEIVKIVPPLKTSSSGLKVFLK